MIAAVRRHQPEHERPSLQGPGEQGQRRRVHRDLDGGRSLTLDRQQRPGFCAIAHQLRSVRQRDGSLQDEGIQRSVGRRQQDPWLGFLLAGFEEPDSARAHGGPGRPSGADRGHHEGTLGFGSFREVVRTAPGADRLGSSAEQHRGSCRRDAHCPGAHGGAVFSAAPQIDRLQPFASQGKLRSASFPDEPALAGVLGREQKLQPFAARGRKKRRMILGRQEHRRRWLSQHRHDPDLRGVSWLHQDQLIPRLIRRKKDRSLGDGRALRAFSHRAPRWQAHPGAFGLHFQRGRRLRSHRSHRERVRRRRLFFRAPREPQGHGQPRRAP